MRKQLIAMLAVSSVLLSSFSALARSLDEDMDIINGNYRTVLKTNDPAEFKSALNNMKAAALDAKQATPPKLEGKAADSAEMKGYRQGMDTLISQIDAALKLADAGKLKEAQDAAQQMKETRNTYHKKYR